MLETVRQQVYRTRFEKLEIRLTLAQTRADIALELEA